MQLRFSSFLLRPLPPPLRSEDEATGVFALVLLSSGIHFTDDFDEHVVDILIRLRRRLHERRSPRLGQRSRFGRSHLPMSLQVAFVAHQNHRNAHVA